MVEEKFKFWREKQDLGVFDIAEFEVWGLEMRFGRNLIRKIVFGFWKMDFRIPNPQFAIEIMIFIGFGGAKL